MSDLIHVTAGGGVGDFIYSYIKRRKWKLLENVKKFNPNLKIAAILLCHSSSANELIAMNPYIDITVRQEWFPPGHEKEKMWKQLINSIDIDKYARDNNIKPGHSKIYLNKSEQQFLNEIKQNKYIVCHPFAGLPHRGFFPHPKDNKYKCYPYYKCQESLINLVDAGYKIVLVGRSEKNMKGIRNHDEKFEVPNKIKNQTYNLVDSTSLRFNAEVTRNANGFLGSHSSMLSAAWTNAVPSVYFYPTRDEHGNVRSVKEHGGETGTWAMDKPWTYGFEMTPNEFLDLSSAKVSNKLLQLMENK